MRLLANRSGALLVSLIIVAAAGGLSAGTAYEDVLAVSDNSLPADLQPYTYSSHNLCFKESSTAKDPVNIVFVSHGFPTQIAAEAQEHGGWVYQGGTQYFGDAYGCYPNDGSPASNADIGPWSGRYHMRHYNHTLPDDEVRAVFNGVSYYGSISSAAAHHEENVWCGHAPDDDTDGTFVEGLNITAYGGFNAGREDVRKNWVFYGDHGIVHSQYWGNTRTFEQCNGWDVSSDGDVYYIRTSDDAEFDGDGCPNVKENGSNPALGGLRNASYPWDFYDVSVPKDGRIDLLNDILGVVNHFAPSGEPPYNAYYDRGPVIGPNAWNRAGPDGKIELLIDILGVIGQFAHDCT